MLFFALSLIVGLACSVITIKTLVGYTEMKRIYKVLIGFAVAAGWFAPFITAIIRRRGWLSPAAFASFSQTAFLLFGVCFLLLCLILLRDWIWYFAYWIMKRAGKAAQIIDPMNPVLIARANLAVVVISILTAAYAFHEGTKMPAYKHVVIETPKISEPFTIAVLSDLHINPTTSAERVRDIVDKTNKMNPDVILLPGDVVDAFPHTVRRQMRALRRLRAKYGVFVTLGNHEFFFGSLTWERAFRRMKFGYLGNTGIKLWGQDVYLAGIPDPRMLRLSDKMIDSISQTLKNRPEGAYTVFVSHSPAFIKRLNKDLVDLQISGHTHGGQIFPFHLIAKKGNAGFLAGLYDVDGMKLYVTRGTGGWGPPMRLFAPAEITLIHLMPEKVPENVAPSGEKTAPEV